MSYYHVSKARNYAVRKRARYKETDVQLEILKYLRARGYPAGKTKTMGVVRNGKYCVDRYLFTGFPDITAFVPELLFIEVKFNKGAQSDNQERFEQLCLHAGNVKYLVARSAADVDAYLNSRK